MTCPECVVPRTRQELQNIYVANLQPTSLQYAAAAGKERCVRDLIAAVADVNEGQSMALYNAIENEHVRCAKLLIRAGADMNIKNCDESPMLLVAAYKEMHSLLKELLNAGADVNIKNCDEPPMLLVAAYKEMHSLLKELLNAGADVNCQNCFTALHVVADMGYPKPMAPLIEAPQGSHSTWKTWKTWKNESTPGKPGNIMEF